MSKKRLFILKAMVGLLALCALAVLLVLVRTPSAHVAAANTNSTKSSYAFTSLVTAGENSGHAITGGLTLNIKGNGTFSGSFHGPDSPGVPAQGQVTGSQIRLSFQVNESQVIQGTGRANASGEYLGTFTISPSDQQKVVSSGEWSALPVANPKGVLAFALHSAITQGPDKGTVFTAAVVINLSTLTGTYSGPAGDLANVTVVFKDKGAEIIASYANGAFIDTGRLVDNPGGYVGTVIVTGSTDKGHWEGYFFTF